MYEFTLQGPSVTEFYPDIYLRACRTVHSLFLYPQDGRLISPNNFHIELERKLSGEYHARVWGFFDDVTLEYIPSDITYNGEILYRKVEKIK